MTTPDPAEPLPPLTMDDAYSVLSREEVEAIVAARPETGLEAIGWASYTAALEAQRAGRPTREVGAIMLAFGAYAIEVEAERAAAHFEAL